MQIHDNLVMVGRAYCIELPLLPKMPLEGYLVVDYWPQPQQLFRVPGPQHGHLLPRPLGRVVILSEDEPEASHIKADVIQGLNTLVL